MAPSAPTDRVRTLSDHRALVIRPLGHHKANVLRRVFSVFLLLAVFCGLLGAFHYYLWARLARDTGLPGAMLTASAVVLGLLGASIPFSLVGGRLLGRRMSTGVFRSAVTWLGVMFISVVAVAVSDALLWVSGLVLPALGSVPGSPSESLPFTRAFAFGALALAVSGVLVSFRQGHRFAVKRVEIALPNLPPALDGFKFVQLSDVHVGPTIGRAFLDEVVAASNALAADAIVITGDLVDGSVASLRDEVAPLKNLRAKYGTFFVTGNHEYYSGAEEWCQLLEAMGIRVLRNERLSLGNGTASLDLLGIDDFSAAQFGRGHGANLPRATAGRDPTRVSVLLAHQPRAVSQAAELGISLQLSGHTHGGQIWPFSLLVKLQQPFVSGLHHFGNTRIYVSNGTGYWGPPMRLFAPAEVTEIVLRAPRVA
jgi:uncharacterized protein